MGLILLSLILRYWINTVEGKQQWGGLSALKKKKKKNQGQHVYNVQTKSNSDSRANHTFSVVGTYDLLTCFTAKSPFSPSYSDSYMSYMPQ